MTNAMRSKMFRWTSLIVVTVGLVGCDSNPGGPAAPTGAPADPGAKLPTAPTKPVRTSKGPRAGNAPQVAD